MSDTHIPADLECPIGLSKKGKKAWKIISDYLIQHDLTYTGGCKAFYSPKEWKARCEEYGTNSHLIIVYDGGRVRECFDPEGGWERSEELNQLLHEQGIYFELCTHWYAAIYDC